MTLALGEDLLAKVQEELDKIKVENKAQAEVFDMDSVDDQSDD